MCATVVAESPSDVLVVNFAWSFDGSLCREERFENFRSLRTNPCDEHPTKTGRIDGRQAPTMPRDDSTIGQYNVGVRISACD